MGYLKVFLILVLLVGCKDTVFTSELQSRPLNELFNLWESQDDSTLLDLRSLDDEEPEMQFLYGDNNKCISNGITLNGAGDLGKFAIESATFSGDLSEVALKEHCWGLVGTFDYTFDGVFLEVCDRSTGECLNYLKF